MRMAAAFAVVVTACTGGLALAHRRIPQLGWGRAHQAARTAAQTLPVKSDNGIQSVAVNWCIRQSPWRVDCGAEAYGSFTTSTPNPCESIDTNLNCVPGYDKRASQTWCQVTVDVLENPRTGRVTTRREPNLSCWDGP